MLCRFWLTLHSIHTEQRLSRFLLFCWFQQSFDSRFVSSGGSIKQRRKHSTSNAINKTRDERPRTRDKKIRESNKPKVLLDSPKKQKGIKAINHWYLPIWWFGIFLLYNVKSLDPRRTIQQGSLYAAPHYGFSSVAKGYIHRKIRKSHPKSAPRMRKVTSHTINTLQLGCILRGAWI